MPPKKKAAEAVPAPQDDVSMVEAPAADIQNLEEGNPAFLASEEQRIRIASLSNFAGSEVLC